MLDRGDILGIAGKSFVSGKLNIQVCDIGVWVCDIAKDLKSWLPTQIYGIPVKKPQITNLWRLFTSSCELEVLSSKLMSCSIHVPCILIGCCIHVFWLVVVYMYSDWSLYTCILIGRCIHVFRLVDSIFRVFLSIFSQSCTRNLKIMWLGHVTETCDWVMWLRHVNGSCDWVICHHYFPFSEWDVYSCHNNCGLL